MREQQFTSWAEATFGKYMPAMKLEVEEWLRPKDGYFIAALRGVVLENHPSAYGKPPGVHELDDLKIEAYAKGHTLEAIAKAGTHKEISAEVIEDVTEEQAADNARRFREMINGKRPEHGQREGVA